MLNENFQNLKSSYLFATVSSKVAEYKRAHREQDIISLGIGDVTLPLVKPVIDTMNAATHDMSRDETFHGYSPDYGYEFLRYAITDYYKSHGVVVSWEDIFVSDGAKSDCGNLTDIFASGITAVIPDPVYPVYLDANVMAGNKVIFVCGTEENGFLPAPPKDTRADLAYLCSPNNPTGAVYSRDALTEWVNWANETGAVIVFDAAYEAFIDDPELPRSIFEIPGAETCAIEIGSFSKTAGFTGVRCGWTVIPSTLIRDGISVRSLWMRRQSTKFNGVGYVVQRAARAALSEAGLTALKPVIDYYKGNALIIARTLDSAGIWYTGGKNSPYIWMKTPRGMKSWDFFDQLLNEVEVVGTPGAGFGSMGEGFFRLTAFSTRMKTIEAVRRMAKIL